MSLLQEPGLAEELIQAIHDVHDYGDWQDRAGYARLDAKARYDSAMRRLGFLVNPAGGALPADPDTPSGAGCGAAFIRNLPAGLADLDHHCSDCSCSGRSGN
jgi:hypothetical protein